MTRYGDRVEQDPAYLRNQSRNLHAMYRRNWTFISAFLFLWFAFFFGWCVVATLDAVAHLGWGFTDDDIRNSAMFLLFGGAFWAFAKLIHSLLLSYVRHTYGSDPAEER